MTGAQGAFKLDPPEAPDSFQALPFSEQNSPDRFHQNGNKHVTPDLRQAYEKIGQALETVEAAHVGLGIHWLPPTTRVREIRRKYQGPLDEFIRLSLLNVPTDFLESYVEDLEGADYDSEASRYLFIVGPSFFERYALMFLVFLVLTILDIALGQAYSPERVSVQLLYQLGICLIAGFVGATMCSERVRRRNFATLIDMEVCRRRGTDHPNLTNIPLHAMKPGPIGE